MKKSTPKPPTKRTQTPGDGTSSTPMSSATPIQATPQLMPQHLRPANHPAKCPTSQSPHPTAILSGTASPWDPLRRVRQGVSIQSLSTILNAQNVYTSESRKRTSREVSESLPLSETGDITKAP